MGESKQRIDDGRKWVADDRAGSNNSGGWKLVDSFMVDRVCLHHSGVALVKDRMELEGGCEGEEKAKEAGADGVAEFELT